MDGYPISSTLCELYSTGMLNVWADCYRSLITVPCDCYTVCCDPLSQCTARFKHDDDIGSDDHFIKKLFIIVLKHFSFELGSIRSYLLSATGGIFKSCFVLIL